MIPGDPPAEPPGPAPPEEEDEEAEVGGEVLLGAYAIYLSYRPRTEEEPPEPEYIAECQILQLPDPGWGCEGLTPYDLIGARTGSPAFGRFEHRLIRNLPGDTGRHTREMWLYYFGPDTPTGDPLQLWPIGEDLAPCVGADLPAMSPANVTGYNEQSSLSGMEIPLGAPSVVVARLGRYNAAGITSEADLLALRLSTPEEEGSDYLAHLDRIDTLAEWSTGTVSGGQTSIVVRDPIASSISVDVTGGPCLIGIELVSHTDLDGVVGHNLIRADLRGEYASEDVPFFNVGPPSLHG